MATINDLPIKNFSDLSDEELTNLILQVRSRRRNPDPEVRAKSVKKAAAKKSKGKPAALENVSKLLQGLSMEDAQVLLEKLRSK